MLDQNMSAGSASALVGYESASQFSRDTDGSSALYQLRTLKKVGCNDKSQ